MNELERRRIAVKKKKSLCNGRLRPHSREQVETTTVPPIKLQDHCIMRNKSPPDEGDEGEGVSR